MGRAVAALTCLHDLDVTGSITARGLEYHRGLVLTHRTGRMAWLASREVDQLDNVPADKVVDLRSADRPPERALDHQQRALAEDLAEFPKEPVSVGRAEFLELG